MKKPDTPPASLTTVELLFACAYLPIIYGSTRPDPVVDTDNIRTAIRLGKLAAKIMANAKE
jgi:hypothetical protein